MADSESRVPTSAKPRKPVAACYCADFLAGDMRHIYRQITGMIRFQPHVIARKRRNADAFPFHPKWVTVLPVPGWRFLRRFWHQSLHRRPVPMSTLEVRDALYAIQRHDARVLHVYFGNIAVQLLPLLRVLRWPFVVSFHGADAAVDTERPAYRGQLREVFARATLVLARSESLLGQLASLGCPPEKLRLNRTGIPCGEIPYRERTPPADGRWRFFQACRLVEKKGLPVALEAFARIRARFPLAEFTIAGDGPMRDGLVAQCQRLGLTGAVHFRGFLSLEELIREMHAAHVFLHPSETSADGNREGVPNAMLEAMATGLPVVATTHGGIPEVIVDGENGLLAAERDPDGLAARILALLESPALFHRLSEASRLTVATRFSARVQIDILEGYYQEAVEAFARERGTNSVNPCPPGAP